MGAGNWPAGTIIAGGDVFVSSPAVPPRTAAAQYNPQTRTIVVKADGSVGVVHFVDQQVAYALSIPLGSIRSAPGIGIDVESIRKATKANLQRVVEDAVGRALGSLLALKSISLGKVSAVWRSGAPSWSVDYRNLVVASAVSKTASGTA